MGITLIQGWFELQLLEKTGRHQTDNWSRKKSCLKKMGCMYAVRLD